MKFKVSGYPKSLKGLSKAEMAGITKKICAEIAIHKYEVSLPELAETIEEQYAWCPATFTGDRKVQNDLDSIRLFALDFDGDITFSDAMSRAEKYHLSVALYYETSTSVNFSKFRLVFACIQEVRDKDLAVLVQHCLVHIFPECDSTSKDFSKLYFPGRHTHYTENVYFSIYDLLLSMMQFLSENDENNKARIIRQIAQKSHVVLLNNTFALFEISDTDTSGAPLLPSVKENYKIEDFRRETIYYNMVHPQKSSKMTLLFSTHGSCTLHSTSERAAKAEIPNGKYSLCQLLCDFLNGKRLSHDEWIGLAMNLIHIKGGQKLFQETIQKYEAQYGDIDRKLEQVQWIKKNEYRPQMCDNYCPYAATCQHKTTMVGTLKGTGREIIKMDETVAYTDISEIRAKLLSELEKCMTIPGIHVRKAPTGSGKTYAYEERALESDKQIIVPVPNAKLMYAVASEATAKGISCMTTPVIEETLMELNPLEQRHIKQLYELGDDESVNYFLRKCENPAAKKYLKKIDSYRRFKGKMIITTHARFLHMKPDFLASRYVIVDEDILPSMIQMNMVSIREIRSLIADDGNQIPVSQDVIEHLSRIISVKGYEVLEPFSREITDDDRAAFNMRIISGMVKSNLYHALTARCFYHKEGEDEIYFPYIKPFPECNCTILSATANEMLYKRLFGSRLTSFMDLGLVRYQGNLELYADYTYSRFCLKEHPELLKNIRKKHPDYHIITFKEFAQSDEVYLGASQGLNYLQGENIAVVGTFHRPEHVYKLWGMLMGCLDTEDTLAVRRVTRNGYNFPIMTYENELLREIQLWMIESEAEQAVGRGRLVSYGSTVKLFSNFPLRQCEIKSKQDCRENVV